MQTIKIRTSQNIEIDYEVANLGDRILARLVDMVLLVGVAYVVFIPVTLIYSTVLEREDLPVAMIVAIVVYTLISVFYDLIAEMYFNGQSVGKRALRVRVIDLSGARPTASQFLLRWVFRLVDFIITLGIGAVIAVAVSEKKQRIGDMVAGTTVVKTQPKAQLKDLFFAPVDESYEPVFSEVSMLHDDDVTLIYEVLHNFSMTGNNLLVYEMAMKTKDHLGVSIPANMNDFEFLQVIVKDYSYITSLNSI
ncbi:putative RDD family membrane protein YckC [Mucilaginibacter oryzae]|uniref:Putative RDD family membrane protein YckC n=1 Tax=Mucilaginibacter oryzae TaxID=468058 RepID=A0A316H7X9_9SPHI|nr:RDD family protein [Mucilaginibacter oryzae]PWK76548.1 putative RDD family membrane protein YckC [Mucilaginibacter oryzae]